MAGSLQHLVKIVSILHEVKIVSILHEVTSNLQRRYRQLRRRRHASHDGYVCPLPNCAVVLDDVPRHTLVNKSLSRGSRPVVVRICVPMYVTCQDDICESAAY